MIADVMDKWRSVWRVGIAPTLSDAALAALGKGLEEDSKFILQGATTSPPPLAAVADWPCEAACPLGYAGWKGDGVETVGAVESFLERVCVESDRLTGDRGSARHLLNWVDDTPRAVVRRELGAEIRREQTLRKAVDG